MSRVGLILRRLFRGVNITVYGSLAVGRAQLYTAAEDVERITAPLCVYSRRDEWTWTLRRAGLPVFGDTPRRERQRRSFS